MWIFSKTSFLSVVADRNNPKKVLIRARCRADLEFFKTTYCPKMGKIKDTPEGDYPFRAWCFKSTLANALRRQAMDIDYPNFKSSLPDLRHTLYMRVWSVLREGERKGEFDGTRETRERSFLRPVTPNNHNQQTFISNFDWRK